MGSKGKARLKDGKAGGGGGGRREGGYLFDKRTKLDVLENKFHILL